MTKPLRLFSWCFPEDSGVTNHPACPEMFEFNGQVIICECECHK